MSMTKRGLFIAPILMCLSLLLASCLSPSHLDSQGTNQNNSPKEENTMCNTSDNQNMLDSYKPKTGEIVTYKLNKKHFQEFLLQPSQEILYKNCDGFSVYKKSTYAEGYVLENWVDEKPSGYFRIGSYPVYTEFIDFINDIDNFKQILSDREIDETLLSCIIIEHVYREFKEDELPPPGSAPQMCIWLHTDKNDYFLEDNPYLYDDPNEPNFLYYDFYNLVEYIQKYGV